MKLLDRPMPPGMLPVAGDAGPVPVASTTISMQTLTRLRSSRELLWNLTLRELRTKYRRSVLGWSWSLLNPLATVAIYGFVFGRLFGAQAERGQPSGIQNFALFLLCGLLPWNFFVLVQNTSMGALIGNAGLVRKVAFPRQVLVFAQVGHGLVQFSIEMTLLAAVLVVAGSPLLPWLPVTNLLMVLLATFAAGLGLALAAIGVYFRDLPYLWGIVLQVWFFATPIVYPPSLLEDKVPPWVDEVLSYNPMARFAAAFRRTFYDGTAPGVLSVLALAALAVATLTVGWKIFDKLSYRFAEEL
jgi:ABC-type polysaccharide/polyol phosphate export permease